MGFGSVSSEIKGRRQMDSTNIKKSLIKLTEEGAIFRSYIDGKVIILIKKSYFIRAGRYTT